MKTIDYFRRYAYVYCYAAALILGAAALFRGAVEAVDAGQALLERTVFILDAGHGGIDGGTTSVSGVLERDLNLQIARRLEQILALLGYDTKMTRTTPDSIATEGTTIRQQKQSDLRNRAALVNGQPNGILISIHQNHYPDAKYAGPQVFQAPTPGSQELAQFLQNALNQSLKTRREIKFADGVYLMQNIRQPGILIECGFLSNPAEDARLQTKEYQNKLCCIIAAALANFTTQMQAVSAP